MKLPLSSFFTGLHLLNVVPLLALGPISGFAGDSPVPPEIVEVEAPLFAGSLSTAWDSKYVTEGRDNLEEGGLVSTAMEFSALGFTGGAWYGNSLDTDYAELNVGLEYGLEFAGFEAYVGYTYLHFEEEGQDDHEIGVGLAYTELAWLVPAVDYVFCESAKGSFIELSLGSEIALIEDKWALLPSLILGIDAGYATEFHDGANHVQFQLGTEYALNETVVLGGYVAQTIALEDVENDGGDDLFFGGVSLTVSF